MVTAQTMAVRPGRGPARSRWPHGRLAPNSAAGISLLLGLCAAAWFSEGSRSGNITGAVVLCGSYTVALGAGSLARRLAPVPAGRLSSMYSLIAEAAVLAGLAAGGQASGLGKLWLVALAVLILVSVRDTIHASGPGPAVDIGMLGRAARSLVAMPAGGRTLLIAVAAPVWGPRTTLLALFAWSIISVGYAAAVRAWTGPASATAAAGSDTASAAGGGLTSLAVLLRPELMVPARLARTGGQHRAARRAARRPLTVTGSTSLTGPVGIDGRFGAPLEPVTAPLPATFPGAEPDQGGARRAGAAAPGRGGRTRSRPAGTQSAAGRATSGQRARRGWPAGAAGRASRAEARVTDVIAACRDDGPAAWWLGRLARGNLTPLPPAILAVAAAGVLGVLGMRHAPGFVMLTPLVVMVLLAGPGCSHRHDGRFDGLVPAVLQAGQYIYIVAVGFASGVPVPVTFTLCLVVAAWCADLAYCGARGEAGEPGPPGPGGQPLGSGMGWEGRMLIVGLGAIAGLTTVAYLGLASYLGALICFRYRASYAVVREGDGR